MVPWLMNDVLFMLVFRLVAMGWQLWIAVMVGVVQFKIGLRMGAVCWLLVVSWLENDVLFKFGFRLVAVGWQLWRSLMVEGVLFVDVRWRV